jgi:hypothetical protein
VKEEEGEAAAWGNRVHKAFDDYLARDVPLDEELATYQPYLDGIKKLPGKLHSEYKMSLSTKLVPCEWGAPDVFVRAISDVLVIDGDHASILDHKTGKPKPNSAQLRLSAILTFAHFPEVNRVKTGFFWLQTGKPDTQVFHRLEISDLWAEFLPHLNQYKNAFRNDIWNPRQSGLCHGWCPVKHCEFWKPKRPKK